ncbi:MAG: carbamoyltransferase HypF, partial [bacterium]
TQCGPRLTIIRKVPYDRKHTSMNFFPMCKLCEKEFHDPESRRFHAQPNACPVCGPHVWLADSNGNTIQTKDPIADAAGLIKQGAILAVKGLGGFHLAVDAALEKAVRTMRFRKAREGKPLAMMSESLEKIGLYAELSNEEAQLMKGALHPILLLKKRIPNPIAPSVAPNQRCFGVMLPYTPLHVLLLQEGFIALVMTSGNLTDEPIAIGNQEAIETLSGIADYFILHNRDILVRCDDSVVMPIEGKPYIVRRSRGYAPLPIRLSCSFEPVLGLGGQMKNSLCVIRDNQAFLSQHIGDLDTPGGRGFFEEALKRTQEIAGVSPQIVAHDLHPDYFTTRIVDEMQEKTAYAIQHHHAHMVSCMADNRLEGPVVGLIFDGTGYGRDGKIWGGEVLVGDALSFDRAAHLSEFPLPGGEAAILNPWRIAAGILYQYMEGDTLPEISRFMDRIFTKDRQLVEICPMIRQMIRKGINTPITTSMGRLFDAVSALLGFHGRISYEGQAAIELEYFASLSKDAEAYPVVISQEGFPWRMEISPVIHAVMRETQEGIPREMISRRFHNTMVQMACRIALLCSERFEMNRVVLSGGCFQNRLLLEGIFHGLCKSGMQVYMHQHVPTNDGGISLGQAVCAGALHEKA